VIGPRYRAVICFDRAYVNLMIGGLLWNKLGLRSVVVDFVFQAIVKADRHPLVRLEILSLSCRSTELALRFLCELNSNIDSPFPVAWHLYTFAEWALCTFPPSIII
jgi:hypothetical protein